MQSLSFGEAYQQVSHLVRWSTTATESNGRRDGSLSRKRDQLTQRNGLDPGLRREGGLPRDQDGSHQQPQSASPSPRHRGSSSSSSSPVLRASRWQEAAGRRRSCRNFCLLSFPSGVTGLASTQMINWTVLGFGFCLACSPPAVLRTVN